MEPKPGTFPSPQKTLLILSGGMDSGVLLADLISRDFEVTALSFDYQAKHSANEVKAAKNLANHFKVPLQTIELPFINQLFSSSLLSSGESLPLGSYTEQNMSSTVVPFRNGIMLSIAAGLAESKNIPLVLIGTHGGDHPVYPDCRPEFNQALAESIYLGSGRQVSFSAPYQDLAKEDIANIGLGLEFPFALSWTCYSGGESHCGRCAACIERRGAIKSFDPTEYLE